MGFDLCRIPAAEKPYYIENIGTNIWSIEELCFYLWQNPYLVDGTLVNESLCDWVREELGLKKLAKTMTDHLNKQESLALFLMPIFREVGYLNSEEMMEYQEQISRLESQPAEMRRKLKADSLVKRGMYSSAVIEYTKILEQQVPGSRGAQFYSDIWNNLGCAFARQFRFEEAADCFKKAWELIRTKEMLRKYVSVLPLYLTEKEYHMKLKELGADRELTERIQEYNARVAKKAQQHAGRKERDPMEVLSHLREDYRRGAGC